MFELNEHPGEQLFSDLLFGSPESPLVYNPNAIDIYIDPQHFMRWLASVQPDEPITGNYQIDCSNMCEFACLYLGLKLYDKPRIIDRMRMYYGRFGGWEHYWASYINHSDEEYFVDLTLRQFIDDAPELAIVKAHNERKPGRYSYLSPPDKLKDYIDSYEDTLFKIYSSPMHIK